MSLEGRLAVVTGAASGIGKETALAFGRAGAEVALVDLDSSGAKDIAARIEEAGGKTATYTADLSDVAQIRDLFERLVDRHGRIDALANVAAIYPIMPTLEVTEEHWDAVLGLNLRGVFFCCQTALKIMLPQGSGAIVNIASGAAFRPIEGMIAYCAAKAGLVGMTRVFAAEARGKGVRVNTLAPGPTLTEGTLAEDADGNNRQDLASTGASGRWLEPAEIADGIVFLCSDQARGVQGAVLNVNAGNWMP